MLLHPLVVKVLPNSRPGMSNMYRTGDPQFDMHALDNTTTCFVCKIQFMASALASAFLCHNTVSSWVLLLFCFLFCFSHVIWLGEKRNEIYIVNSFTIKIY